MTVEEVMAPKNLTVSEKLIIHYKARKKAQKIAERGLPAPIRR